jgi:dienelactone hydrolase
VLEHLGEYTDLVDFAAAARPLYRDGGLGPAEVRELIGFGEPAPVAREVQVQRRWSAGGVAGEQVSWSVGYGPRTVAWLLRPADADGPLPGVLALHGHDAYKYLGKEKIADGPQGTHPDVAVVRDRMYEGRAFANELARLGFTVLVPDVFLWGSRRFDVATMPGAVNPPPENHWIGPEGAVGDGQDVRSYNRLAARHEHLVAKYCTLLGTSVAGVVSYEDRISAGYLQARPDVVDGPLGCVGLSGGGCRAALLNATCPLIGAAVVVGMMSTYPALLDRHVANHTWMLFPPGLAARGDWPDLAAARAPSPLLVQYLRDDALFPLAGMRSADTRLRRLYERAGAADNYLGQFYPGPHRFDRTMQEAAFTQLGTWLLSERTRG